MVLSVIGGVLASIIGAVLVGIFNSLRSIHRNLGGLHRDIGDLRERMARLEVKRIRPHAQVNDSFKVHSSWLMILPLAVPLSSRILCYAAGQTIKACFNPCYAAGQSSNFFLKKHPRENAHCAYESYYNGCQKLDYSPRIVGAVRRWAHRG